LLNLKSTIANGLEVISCGANVPCWQRNLFGPIMEDVDHKVSLIQTLYLMWYGSCICLFHGEKTNCIWQMRHFPRYLRNHKKQSTHALNSEKLILVLPLKSLWNN
jgi:hypothetical protein